MQEDRALDYYLNRAFQRLDLPDVASEIKVERVYRQLAGELISKLTPKVMYHEGELKLKLSSPALKQEMLTGGLHCYEEPVESIENGMPLRSWSVLEACSLCVAAELATVAYAVYPQTIG